MGAPGTQFLKAFLYVGYCFSLRRRIPFGNPWGVTQKFRNPDADFRKLNFSVLGSVNHKLLSEALIGAKRADCRGQAIYERSAFILLSARRRTHMPRTNRPRAAHVLLTCRSRARVRCVSMLDPFGPSSAEPGPTLARVLTIVGHRRRSLANFNLSPKSPNFPTTSTKWGQFGPASERLEPDFGQGWQDLGNIWQNNVPIPGRFRADGRIWANSTQHRLNSFHIFVDFG